jgi:hypothetical protein
VQALVGDLGAMIDAARKPHSATGTSAIASNDVLEGRRASCNFTPAKQESSTGRSKLNQSSSAGLSHYQEAPGG